MEALLIAGTAMSAIGSIQQGNAARQAADYNAAVAERNAAIQNNNAILARQQAVSASEQQRKDAARTMGRMRAGYAASGVQMEGSPLDVLASSAAAAELDTLNIVYNGVLKGASYDNEAQGLRESASMERARGRNAQTQGYMNAGSSLLLGLGTAGMKAGWGTQAPAPVVDGNRTYL